MSLAYDNAMASNLGTSLRSCRARVFGSGNMTKRKLKSHKPTGANKNLGRTLLNQDKVRTVIAESTNRTSSSAPDKKVLASVTHETDLEQFFNNATLADEKFASEREGTDNFKILPSTSSVVKAEDLKSYSLDELNRNYGHLLTIPRRPRPDNSRCFFSPEELRDRESEEFLRWRRGLATLTESNGIVLTPFERNLEIWRQLWRVVERSDVVVQIVDARNPLLFLNSDLRSYVKEVDPRKLNLTLVNKTDLLTQNQVEEWHRYFSQRNIDAIFWSALNEQQPEMCHGCPTVRQHEGTTSIPYFSSSGELLAHFKAVGRAAFGEEQARPIVVGLIGYPNVGKSSTINCLLGEKKTSVSATPGKTKHFQTIMIDDELTLCDSPGLVMPSFGFNTSEMLLNGVLPIDQMRDHYSPVQLLINRFPHKCLQSIYSMPVNPGVAEGGRPKSHDFLATLSFMKGFMSASGIPDCSRAARLILKDVVSGKVRWNASPPDLPQAQFDKWTYEGIELNVVARSSCPGITLQLNKRNLLESPCGANSTIDRSFFAATRSEAHLKQVHPDIDIRMLSKKHGNRGKREKLRRVFAHLDA